ncbi:TPA: hypothetical protein EYP26_02265 [Candidatus Bathyarchaeota archaeon]|nr:hypothetical protein [Candidatus Bathyarchaeota archaeon]
MVKIALKKFGRIPKETEKEILGIIKECYERLPHSVELLDILLFENPSFMKSFYFLERRAVGVVTEDFGDSFLARHDAWRGTPRIAVCLETMERAPRLIQIGSLRHEVGHSILHGSIEYYVFPITKKLAETSRKFNLPKGYSFNLTYLISIAVKDFEVAKLLLGGGYVRDQIAYSRYLLKPSKDDLTAWRLSEGNPALMALCLAGRLKDLACLIALSPTVGRKHTIKKMMEEGLSYLPREALGRMLKFAEKLPRTMVGDTFQNFNIAMDMFIEDLLSPLLEAKLRST